MNLSTNYYSKQKVKVIVNIKKTLPLVHGRCIVSLLDTPCLTGSVIITGLQRCHFIAGAYSSIKSCGLQNDTFCNYVICMIRLTNKTMHSRFSFSLSDISELKIRRELNNAAAEGMNSSYVWQSLTNSHFKTLVFLFFGIYQTKFVLSMLSSAVFKKQLKYFLLEEAALLRSRRES